VETKPVKLWRTGAPKWARRASMTLMVGALLALPSSLPVDAQAPLPIIPIGTPVFIAPPVLPGTPEVVGTPILVGTPVSVGAPAALALTTPVTTFYPQISGLSIEPAPVGLRGVSLVAYAPDGLTLAVGTPFGIDLFSVSVPNGVQYVDYIRTGAALTALAYSPDGNLVASGTFTGTVQLWDLGTGVQRASLEAAQGAVNELAFSPDGGSVVAAGSDGAVRVWRTSDGQLLQVLKGHSGAVLSLSFSPDGRSVVSGGADGKVLVWQLSSGLSMSSLVGNVGGVPAVTFDPTGNLVGLGSGDGVVRIWDLKAGKLAFTLAGHRGEVTAVDFSPDGTTLASASYDGNTILWGVADGKLLRSLPGPTALGSLAFAPDATLLATGALDGAVQLWTLGGRAVPPGAPVIVVTPAPVAPVCVDDAAFVADVTLPDNSVVAPGSLLNKTWRVRNSGTCNWGSGYRFAFAGGSQMNAAPATSLPGAAPGATVDVTVPMYAPASPGTYDGIWQFLNASGQPFGARVTVRILVPAPATPAPAVGINIAASATDVNAGDSVTIRATVQGVSAAWLDGQPITNNYREETLQLCADQTFMLDAQLRNGQHQNQTVTVHVRGSCERRADLVMKSLSADHTTAHVGEVIHLSAKIENDGNRDAKSFAVGWDPDNGAGFIIAAADITIDQGDEQTVTWTYAYPATGSFHSRVKADYYNDVDESDKGNNEKGLTLKIVP
jgi:hypothetical protein